MSIIPEDQLKAPSSFNLTSMVDFLFLMLAFFATLAITKTSIFDSQINLISMQKQENEKHIQLHSYPKYVNISISQDGAYKWLTDISEYNMQNIEQIQKELLYQHKIGILPEEKKDIKILLHIDQQAPWQSIASLIYATKELGFQSVPIYEDKKEMR